LLADVNCGGRREGTFLAIKQSHGCVGSLMGMANCGRGRGWTLRAGCRSARGMEYSVISMGRIEQFHEKYRSTLPSCRRNVPHLSQAFAITLLIIHRKSLTDGLKVGVRDKVVRCNVGHKLKWKDETRYNDQIPSQT
jgi:hypothetical protein